MRAYTAIFKMKLISGLQYRAAAWAGVATQFFWGFMILMIYAAFYRSSSVPPPMRFEQLAAYTWLQQSFLALIMLWWQDDDLLSMIESGHVAYELCRPYRLYSFWYVRLLANRIASVALRCVPILVVALLLPAPYALPLPAGVGSGVLFICSLLLALLLVAAMSMFIYILTFITLSAFGSRIIVTALAEFMMGAVLPLPLLPVWLQKVLDFFPFRYTSDLPFRVYSGNIEPSGALRGMALQGLWIAGLVLAGLWSFQRIQKRVVIQGG